MSQGIDIQGIFPKKRHEYTFTFSNRKYFLGCCFNRSRNGYYFCCVIFFRAK
jgi:hypothetical protein